jgi:hypothetical protein
MRDGVTVEFDVHFARGSAGRREVLPGEAPAGLDLPAGSVPRVSKLMALAIRCEELVRRGEVADYADLGRLGHVTRARMTQIMNLLNLAPDIQEEILFLPRTQSNSFFLDCPMSGKTEAAGPQNVRPTMTSMRA